MSLASAALGAALLLVPALAAAPGAVVVIPVHGKVDEGMAHFVDRAVSDAEAQHAAAIVLDVDTFGGLATAGSEIRDRLLDSSVPVDAYVSGRAWSVGALVTLAATRVAMAPAASIGAAEPVPNTPQTVSAQRAEFVATALARHRDTTMAAAMVDASVSEPAYGTPGAVLTLPAGQAMRAGIADSLDGSRREALADWHLDPARVVTPGYTLAEQVVRFVTDPSVSGILLAIGFLGLLIEMQTLHLVAGVIGTGAFALFFGSHVYAGFSDSLVIGLAIAGLLGILLELHVLPGHGVAGVLGVLALVGAVVLAFGLPFAFVAAQSLAIAIVLTVVALWFGARLFPRNAFMARLAFAGVQGADYVTAPDRRELIGQTGIAASYLRPSGVAAIGGERVDVLTEGEFVAAGSPVTVTRVEGARIFVRSGV
jgi:membrane-bound serine protease (ClpP class)